VDENNLHINSEMAKIMSLPIELESSGKSYPKIEMGL
jgi:hypothetical protein